MQIAQSLSALVKCVHAHAERGLAVTQSLVALVRFCNGILFFNTADINACLAAPCGGMSFREFSH
jgi:hypothetical protein